MNDIPLPAYDRAAEDLGNMVELGHVNTRIPDQQRATLFYVSGLGLTRDPYLMTGTENMWINAGRSQFHLPTGNPQVVGGRTGLVVPDLEALLRRLAAVRRPLEGTAFGFEEGEGWVDATSPWGNRIRLHAPGAAFGPVTLGMPYVEFEVAPGAADGIARFYAEVIGARAEAGEDGQGRAARVMCGPSQYLVFRETSAPLRPFDGAHIQVTLIDFSGPHRRLAERGLITEESNQHQYRFEQIVDPASGRALFRMEHEVRSATHPMFGRKLVNRNPAQRAAPYLPGHDDWVWTQA